MSETLTPAQYLARSAAQELKYAMQQVNEMQQQVERIKTMAERLIKTCDWLLTGDATNLDDNEF